MTRDVQLGGLCAFGDLLNYVAIAIASRKIHQGVDANGIPSQYRVYVADALEELPPVERRKQTHAGDDVAYGDLSSGLPLMLEMNNLLDGDQLRGELLFYPVKRWPHLRILIAQPLRELHYKGSIKHLASADRRLKGADQLVGLPPANLKELIRELVRLFSCIAGCHHPRRKATEVLYKGDSQSDCNSPQLPDGERPHGLVRTHKSTKGVGVETAVGVSDQRQRDGIDARVACKNAAFEFGQLFVVALGQVSADLAKLLFDNMKVVD